MRDLAYPYLHCALCGSIAFSPRRLCSHCETQEAMKKATIQGRCTYCRNLCVVTNHNLFQEGEDRRYTLICENCEERG